MSEPLFPNETKTYSEAEMVDIKKNRRKGAERVKKKGNRARKPTYRRSGGRKKGFNFFEEM